MSGLITYFLVWCVVVHVMNSGVGCNLQWPYGSLHISLYDGIFSG